MRHYQRVVAEINLDAIIHNYREIRKYLSEGTKICSVIKADGYGHGAIPIAKTLSEEGVDAFAVAASHEAVLLRKNNIHCPILVLGYTSEDDYHDMVKHDITQTVFRLDMAEKLSAVAMQLGKMARIHIKIDTGMGRIGFEPDDQALQIIKKISKLPMIKIEGIFTHFSRADESDHSTSHIQLDIFKGFIAKLKEAGIEYFDLHMSNSAGLIEVHQAEFNMVRVGIALYGLYPSYEVDHTLFKLKPALTLKSNIILLKEMDEGMPISYGGTYVTGRKTKVATIPVGYGDGYPRALSSKGRVLIRGSYAPVIGRICMDQFMVDVTDIEGVKEGDVVVLIGDMMGQGISVEEIASHMDTINYEVVCQLGKRIPRVYYKNQKPVLSIDYF
ncbi:Alanine racemase [Petrocella atlantisensis]|uniref:Alanine racemase n=1 Tax=Petrocella atlantisensis TaxID=2173034 RepID=A0A3P7S313_9FIRM|nr:alanine racemase [Petrocella atlantisensis]PKM53962.1 MAG: alanine racemase [Firmicutes bacterium HGW-Firmicutes-5]VDN49216.1 Alanine racemase [Petrocella atlantisensis]